MKKLKIFEPQPPPKNLITSIINISTFDQVSSFGILKVVLTENNPLFELLFFLISFIN